MCLSQSDVLWQGRDGIQKIVLFGKRPSSYYGKNSSNKQREVVHHYFKTKKSRTLNVSSSAVAKTIKRYDETGSREDRHWKTQSYLCCRVEFIRVTSLWNCSPNKCFTEFSNRHISTSTVQRRLLELGFNGWLAAKKPLQKDTNNKKRLAWAKKHEQWTLDWWKSVLWSGESKF